jgi:hypothetical protein
VKPGEDQEMMRMILQGALMPIEQEREADH